MIACDRCGNMPAMCNILGWCANANPPRFEVHWTWLHGPIGRRDPHPMTNQQWLQAQTERTRRRMTA